MTTITKVSNGKWEIKTARATFTLVGGEEAGAAANEWWLTEQVSSNYAITYDFKSAKEAIAKAEGETK